MRKQAHSAVLAYPRQQLVDAVDTLGQHDQRSAQGNGVAQALMTHGVVLDSVDIRDVRQSDAAADQFAAAEADRVRPDFLQKGGGIAGVSQRRVAGFSAASAWKRSAKVVHSWWMSFSRCSRAAAASRMPSWPGRPQ